METLDKIREIIDYDLEHEDAPIDILLKMQRKVSGYMIYMVNPEIEALNQYMKREKERKAERGKYLIKNDGPITKLNETFNHDCQQFIDNEIEAYTAYKELQIGRQQINEWLTSIQQRISFQKREYELTTKQ